MTEVQVILEGPEVSHHLQEEEKVEHRYGGEDLTIVIEAEPTHLRGGDLGSLGAQNITDIRAAPVEVSPGAPEREVVKHLI